MGKWEMGNGEWEERVLLVQNNVLGQVGLTQFSDWQISGDC
jgi:hypothetical protein